MKALKLITCSRCKQRREPVVKHGLFCAPCWKDIEAEDDRRASEARTTGIFALVKAGEEAERHFREDVHS